MPELNNRSDRPMDYMVPLLMIVALTFTGCAGISSPNSGSFAVRYQSLDSPAGDRSSEPNITRGAGGALYLSWIEETSENTHALVFSKRNNGSWSEPTRIADGDNWFVNWADFPAMAALNPSTVMASWLERMGEEKYAYGVRISISNDRGQNWGKPFFVHRDSTPTEHGFVSLLPTTNDRARAIWLDGRETVREDGPMTLRTATIDSNGKIVDEYLLDPRVCDCCQTSAARAGDGSLVVVYRDRGDDEMRDISVTRFDGTAWSEPKWVHEDGWQIAGCPVNGPAVAASDSLVAVAWFTVGSEDIPAVNVAFSHDHGRSFADPLRIDTGDPSGRVDVVFADQRSVIVCWIENSDKTGNLMIRRVAYDGRTSKPIKVANISSERESGFPHLGGAANGEILIAWTDTTADKRVRTAVITTN